jgi:hypothetical protein
MFQGVTRLEIKGGGDIAIKPDGTIKGATKAEQKNTTLIIKCGSTKPKIVANSNMNGFMVFNNYKGSVICNQGVVVLDVNKKTKDYFLGLECCIEQIKLSGSAYLAPLPDKFVADELSVSLSGSGTVVLPAKHFCQLSIELKGNGDVIGEEAASANKVNISLCGSGDVNGIHVHESGVVSLVGSGDIRISATNPKEMVKTKTGPGSLKIKKK